MTSLRDVARCTRSRPRLTGLKRALDAESLSPKRLLSSGDLDAWYPYYAGFSSVFARRVLESMRLPTDARVLDPWNGSGTTSCAAYELGLRATGIDLNPAAGVISVGKLAAIALDARLLERAADTLAERFGGRNDGGDTEGLSSWLDRRSANLMRRLVGEASDVGEGFAPRSRRLRAETGFGSITSFLLLCLLRSGRQLALKRSWSNPTWVKMSEPGTLRAVEWREAFLRTARSFLFEAHRRDVIPGGRARVMTGNAVALADVKEDFDVVLTSPPYCTRIDYAMTMGFELAALGLGASAEFRSLRERLMGTPVLRPVEKRQHPQEHVPDVERVLRRVSEHPSYASSGYYFRNLSQYFVDAQASLHQISSKLRSGGVCLIVVQNSYYKEVEIDLPCLYASMAKGAGFRESTIPFSIPVRSFFAGINGRAARHLTERSYREAVVVMRK